MNFLAHLHLASLAESSLLGNLLADFIRGNPDEKYSLPVISGIHMHRRIDRLTDSLPEVVTARQWFRPQTRRVSPIALDVMWDHFLSRHWNTLSPTIDLDTFIITARAEIEPALSGMPEAFITLNRHLWSECWLERYGDMAFIANVLNGIANRRPKLNALRETWQDLDLHYHELEKLFWQLYPRMMKQARQKSL